MLSNLAFAAVLLSPAQSVQSNDVLDVVFSEVERRLICEHFGAACRAPRPDGDDDRSDSDRDRGRSNGRGRGRGGAKGLPPGLAKRDSLPPGLQRQLDERGRLPPGLEKRALPDSLRERLPRRPSEVEIVVVDRDVLLIQAATGLVYDAIADIVRD